MTPDSRVTVGPIRRPQPAATALFTLKRAILEHNEKIRELQAERDALVKALEVLS